MKSEYVVLKAGDIITLKDRPYLNLFPLPYCDINFLIDRTYVWLDDFDGSEHYDMPWGKYSLTLDDDKEHFTYRVEEQKRGDIYLLFRNSEIASGIRILAFEHVEDLQFRFLGEFMEEDEVCYKYRPIGRRYRRVRDSYEFEKIEEKAFFK